MRLLNQLRHVRTSIIELVINKTASKPHLDYSPPLQGPRHIISTKLPCRVSSFGPKGSISCIRPRPNPAPIRQKRRPSLPILFQLLLNCAASLCRVAKRGPGISLRTLDFRRAMLLFIWQSLPSTNAGNGRATDRDDGSGQPSSPPNSLLPVIEPH